MPGTLMYLAEEANVVMAVDDPSVADYILKWARILAQGLKALERKLNRNRRRSTRSPRVFATLPKNTDLIQLAHGFEPIVVDDDKGHPADG
jgi:hypothetical protein